MRVTFYAPMKPPGDPVPSGDRRVARLLVAALERGGATVTVASSFRAYDRGDPVRQERLAGLGRRLAQRLLARWRARPAEKPDLWFTYHLYHKAPDHLGPVVAAALGIPYVVAEASHAPKQAGGPWDQGFRAAEAAIRAADRIYCLNPVDAACLAPVVAGPDVLADLPPFVDTAPYRRPEGARVLARDELERTCGLLPEVPLLLTVAMMRDDQKLRSYAVLAKALALLGSRPWQLLVVGDGPAAPAVRDLMAPFGARVVFAGLCEGERLLDAYAGADLFVWPAVKEAVGLVFLEAAASGLAVVAGRSGGIDHVVAAGATGLVVPAGDASALAKAVASLLDDPSSRAAMGVAGARRAAEVNDISAAAGLFASDLADLISRRTESRRP
ncbi:glycosyl transferase family 1 [Aureimonas sp. SA4125]|uniref:glycosyltransferase family 4 protein n=1 Tax=Aureimonas sp. SA4125 TaxID=2826993 RepID=UPI001CC6867A|nr:glycosyltransferase family 4 protein [Aureimonas sp. SA4125]BDA82567.1 glycosyl transferase family 1 [Aureimonas sp. SA4125]